MARLLLQGEDAAGAGIALVAQLFELELAGGGQRDFGNGEEGAGGDQEQDDQRVFKQAHGFSRSEAEWPGDVPTLAGAGDGGNRSGTDSFWGNLLHIIKFNRDICIAMLRRARMLAKQAGILLFLRLPENDTPLGAEWTFDLGRLPRFRS